MPTARINGCNLWYDDWKLKPLDENGLVESLIFLHGYTGCRHNWGFNDGGCIKTLFENQSSQQGQDAIRYRCIFVESRGIGGSDKIGPYSISQQASDVLSLADHLGIDRFTFCGHSMGGGVGWYLLAIAPHRLHKTVLMAPIPSGGFPQAPNEVADSRTHVLQHYGYPKYTSKEQVMKRYSIVHENRKTDTAEWFEHRSEIVANVSDSYWNDGWKEVINFRIPRPLATVQTPVLIIAGATDSLLYENVRDCAALADGVLHVCCTAGHEVALQDPNGVAAAIHSFMVGETISQKAHRALIHTRLIEGGHTIPQPKL
eukprot:m.115946 g.115946  ORF g.115946 m.115946 type:complete len:315 (+) comp17160_c0_seq1:275-1219(+)